MKTLVILLLISFTFPIFAQERAILHIGKDGKQEIIPLKKGERAQDVIARMEKSSTSIISKAASPDGMTDTLKWYSGPADGSSAFASNSFIFFHQDVAMVWFDPAASGYVKEFWIRMSDSQNEIKKGTVRAWYVNPKLKDRPTTAQTKHMGFYKDTTDGDGLVTPFKPATGDQWFYGNGASDSATWNFDPLGTEVSTWLPGGLQVTLDSAKWQGIKLEDWGNPMHVNLGQPFGFTFQNDAKVSDIVGGNDLGTTIRFAPNSNSAPYHSYKFYETGRTSSADKGWWLRGDNDWGMYVVILYEDVPHTIFIPGRYGNTLNPGPRKICATISDGNPGGDPPSIDAYLFYRFGEMSKYDSVQMIPNGTLYCGEIPRAHPGDLVYWLIKANINGKVLLYPGHYKIFQRTQDRLFIYNNAQYSLGTGALIYTSSSSKYDCWSAPNDGIGELDTLFSLYDKILVADGSFPGRNVYPALNTWLGTGTASVKKNLFFTSQDYGCYITPNCNDTTFAVGSFEEKYLGINKLGPQDQGLTNRPVKMVPQTDTITNYIIQYNADSATTLWYYPTYELGFSAYPDFFTPTASAKPLFKDPSGTNIYGVRNSGTGFNAVFLALDAGALQFRIDTSLHNVGYTSITDPKYQWIVDIKSLSNSFFDGVTDIKQREENVPTMYSLSQNYPNPFNPSTTINYEIPFREQVQIVIYNVLGQHVLTVVNEVKEAGAHTATFNAQSFASGLYFYEMRAGSFVNVKKMILMK